MDFSRSKWLMGLSTRIYLLWNGFLLQFYRKINMGLQAHVIFGLLSLSISSRRYCVCFVLTIQTQYCSYSCVSKSCKIAQHTEQSISRFYLVMPLFTSHVHICWCFFLMSYICVCIYLVSPQFFYKAHRGINSQTSQHMTNNL